MRLSNRPIRSARKRAWKSAAAATRRSAIAAPAGTPSDRASVRCARKGFSSKAQPAAISVRSTSRARVESESSPSCNPSHRARGRANGRKGARPADRDVERFDGGGRGKDRFASDVDAILGSRPDEAEREMQPLEPDPADVATAARNACAADRFDERGDARRRLGRERDRDEQPATGQVGAGPAGATARDRHAVGSVESVGSVRLAVSRSHAVRSARSTSRARSRSRQPRTSTVLSSSALYVSKKWLDLDQAVRPDLVETLDDVLLVGDRRWPRTGP